jgi:hypothetical protein
MSLGRTAQRRMMIRLAASVFLAAIALWMFFLSRPTLTSPPEPEHKVFSSSLAREVDHEVDAVLARFNIEKRWIRKTEIALPHTDIKRIERRVVIPADIAPLQINVALNTMARQFDGRAVASENLKENSVTIHIELDGYVVQSIILKTNPALKRAPASSGDVKT